LEGGKLNSLSRPEQWVANDGGAFCLQENDSQDMLPATFPSSDSVDPMDQNADSMAQPADSVVQHVDSMDQC